MNTLLTSTMISNAALMILVNELTAAQHVNRQYDGMYGVDGAKIGYTLNIRKPPRYLGTDGPGLSLEDMQDSTVPLTLAFQNHVDTQITSADLRLTLVSFSDQYLKPAMATLANKIDFRVLQNYKKIANFNGVVGTTPNTSNVYLNAGAALDNEACPRDGLRSVVISPNMQATIVPALQGLFNPAPVISDQFRKGQMGKDTLGFDWFMDQNTPTHVVGQLGTTGAVTSNPLFVSFTNVLDANGIIVASSIVTSGWDASIAKTLRTGDVIQIAASNAVNPQSRQSIGSLRNLAVQQDVDSDGAGAATILVTPPIISAGAFQTVDVAPVLNAAITVFSVAFGGFTALQAKQTVQGLAYHRDAITLAFADLPLPGGVDMAGRASDPQLRMSVRFVRAYDPQLDRLVSRLDVLYGTQTLRQELATRLPT